MVLTSPNIVLHHTVFMTKRRRYLCERDMSGHDKYRGYAFERVFVLCCNVHGVISWWQRIANGNVALEAERFAAVEGWKTIEWSARQGYHAVPCAGPDMELGACNERELLGTMFQWLPGQEDLPF